MRIVILSRGPQLYSTQRILNAGRKKGHTMQIVDHARCHLITEKGKSEIFFEDQHLKRIDGVIPRIGASVTLQGAAVIAQLEAMGAISTVHAKSLMVARNKWRSLQLLAHKGIDIPKSVAVGSGRDFAELIGAIGGPPVVVKLEESTHGIGVLLARSLKQAKSTIEAFQSLKGRVIIQEFIEESGGKDIRVIVIGDRVVAAMERRAEDGEFRANIHRGAQAVEIQLTEEEKAIALKAAQLMNLGVAGVDLLRSNRGPLVLEINASPGLEGIEAATKVDVADRIVNFLVKRIKKHRSQAQPAKARKPNP